MDDWKKLSKFHHKVLGINIYILNWYDIIITKICRCEDRDIEDIKSILEKIDLDLEKLEKRYFNTIECAAGNEENYKIQFNAFKYKMRK